jgi:hypothetical protein
VPENSPVDSREARWRGFADESYGPHDYYVAVVVTDEAQQAALDAGFAALRQEAAEKWGVSPDIEFHAYDIMQGSDDWAMLRGRVGDAASLYRKLLKTVVDSGAKVAIQGVDTAALAARFENPPYAHEAAARLALEQVDRWCEQAGVGTIDITADEISSDTRFATDVFNRAIDGTTVTASEEHVGQQQRRAGSRPGGPHRAPPLRGNVGGTACRQARPQPVPHPPARPGLPRRTRGTASQRPRRGKRGRDHRHGLNKKLGTPKGPG